MNTRHYHQYLHRQLIGVEQRPCVRCGSMGERDLHRLVPRLGYIRDNVIVLCIACHVNSHYQGKFQVGDRVYLNGRTPAYIELARHRPRTIVAVEYSPALQANLYTLGSNARGACEATRDRHGYSLYCFRSYQLHPWHKSSGQGRPKAKRVYKRRDGSGHTIVLPGIEMLPESSHKTFEHK